MSAAARPPRGEARRALILEATLRVVSQVGVGAVTHRRVATEAGLPLAATTYWFSSKDELLAEAYRLAVERDIARVRAMAEQLRASPAGDVAEALTALLTAELGGERSTMLAYYALWLEAARRPALRGIEDEWTGVFLAVMHDVLREAGSADPELDARVLIATIDGLLLEQLVLAGSDPAAAVRPVLQRLVGALLAG